jgi:flavin-dependent dehydrogenase
LTGGRAGSRFDGLPDLSNPRAALINMNPPAMEPLDHDVAIIGGALAGAATAIQLLEANPRLRVLILERSEVFTRRVGEATIELSTYFLNRVLGLSHHLNEHHYPKQGLRFWFANRQTRSLGDCAEVGGRYQVRLPANLVDRARLDTAALERAMELGATLWRPAKVDSIKLVPGGAQELVVEHAGETKPLRVRWIVDASGVAALLARRQGWHRVNDAHPTAAAWARWRHVRDWDSPTLAKKFPQWATATFSTRNTATNHFMGDGWWAWWIPLKGGDVSIGVVWDQRRLELPPGENLAVRVKQFLIGRHPAAAEMMSEATPVEGDVHLRRNLAYSVTTTAGDGFVLVGDAAGFLDPFYSPGLDWLAFTTARAADLIDGQLTGRTQIAREVARHNRDFAASYGRWFEAIYRNKYDYLGDFELMRLAFLLDLGLYYLGIVTQPFYRGPKALLEPYFSTPPSTPFYHFMRTYNRRFAAMSRDRRRRGVFGRRNTDHRFIFGGYSLKPAAVIPILKATAGWVWLELTEGWRTWFGEPEVNRSPEPVAPTSSINTSQA